MHTVITIIEQLRDDLLKLFQRFADRSDRLIHIGTSQANESLNHIIATKAHKAKHFGGSESLNYRVAAGVAKMNGGRKYIVDVNENHGLSPGKVTVTKTIKLDEKPKRDGEKKSYRLLKGRKKITMGPDGDHLDIDTIPDPSDLELLTRVDIDSNEDFCVVIETTGFGSDFEIVQLSAVCNKGEFDKYIIPTKSIHPKSTEVTHLFSTGTRLHYKGRQLVTEPKENALNSFVDWLPKIHYWLHINVKQFDAKILVSQMQPSNSSILQNLQDHILGFSDTFPLFRVKYLKRKSYSQSSLANDILQTTYNAHNALDDVKMLKELIEVENAKEQLIENSFVVHDIERQLKMFHAKKHLMVSYNGVIREKIMSKARCDRAAGSGLSFEHIKSSFS
ncbi:unnamed protein product [Mytilus coruscus]|uniref:Exonuclease domain-containing protein n=1 Tax=Mytilus coruscus TaxID=42192 RepID=A0A6J7ZW14_MYTCO|nr:unnamed protein product [Mytilus coruscus]